jgi:acyl-coenzyme A thioesterase PaaI-like protein
VDRALAHREASSAELEHRHVERVRQRSLQLPAQVKRQPRTQLSATTTTSYAYVRVRAEMRGGERTALA